MQYLRLSLAMFIFLRRKRGYVCSMMWEMSREVNIYILVPRINVGRVLK